MCEGAVCFTWRGREGGKREYKLLGRLDSLRREGDKVKGASLWAKLSQPGMRRVWFSGKGFSVVAVIHQPQLLEGGQIKNWLGLQTFSSNGCQRLLSLPIGFYRQPQHCTVPREFQKQTHHFYN